MAETPHTIRLWDLPLRLFHWLLVVAVAAAIGTGLAGGDWMTWHQRAGLSIAGLLSFRLVWGVIGSETARFRTFVRGPGAIWAYLQGRWQGIGHNPLGSLSVVAILLVLGVQVGTGLFTNDEIAFTGPLASLVSEDTSLWLTGKHRLLVYGVYALLALHVTAIVGYRVVKRVALVPPMVHGRLDVPAHQPAPRAAARWAWPVAVLIAVAAVLAAAGAFTAR